MAIGLIVQILMDEDNNLGALLTVIYRHCAKSHTCCHNCNKLSHMVILVTLTSNLTNDVKLDLFGA